MSERDTGLTSLASLLFLLKRNAHVSMWRSYQIYQFVQFLLVLDVLSNAMLCVKLPVLPVQQVPVPVCPVFVATRCAVQCNAVCVKLPVLLVQHVLLFLHSERSMWR